MVCVITLTRMTKFSCTFHNQLHFSANELACVPMSGLVTEPVC